MTNADRHLLDSNLKKFDSFIELHKFLFLRNIELTHEEWEEYRDKFLRVVKLRDCIEKTIEVDLKNIIMP
jgi:16S rRNA G527 N7-methylase RsmG